MHLRLFDCNMRTMRVVNLTQTIIKVYRLFVIVFVASLQFRSVEKQVEQLDANRSLEIAK